MIDIHPPQHAPMTFREFFTHLFIVILGILIAIGLEQSVEYLHHRHLASEARRALLAERDTNESSNQLNIFATKRHQRDLQHDLALLQAVRAHQPLPPGPFIVRHVRYLYLEDEWRKIHQSGTINYLAENLAGVEYRYTNQDAFMEHVDRSNEDLYRAASILRTAHDPLDMTFESNIVFNNFLKRFAAAHENLPQQEVDAAWATLAEPADFNALSPSQIESLEHAIQVALVDDDALLTYSYNIKRTLRNNPAH
jgi:transcription elongation GreA/GreB family factor